MRSLSSLSSSIIGAGVGGAKVDLSPEEAAAAKAAADSGRAREEGEEARVVGVEDAAEAARQRAASRTAEQTAEAMAAELTGDGMEYDRLIHAHRSSIAREEGEEARVAAAEDAGEAARQEAHAAAKRRASTREEEEVHSAHLISRVLHSTWRGGGCTVLHYPTIYAYHIGETPAGGRQPGRRASHWQRACLSPPSRGVHCRPSKRQHLPPRPAPPP